MMLFRSEEEAQQWSAGTGRPPGAILSLEQLRRLAVAWYGDRMLPGWRPRTRPQSQAVLASVGLAGDFWNLG